jgi:LuxR family maltose regulon positive regulatory protein
LGYNVRVKTEILRTKLHIPQPKPVFTPRPHLIERLNDGLTRKLIVVSAPAGFGKTTLIAEFGTRVTECANPQSEIRNPQLAWLSLDRSDNDPIRFWTYFIAALQRIEPKLGEDALTLLAASPPHATLIEAVLTSLINDIATETAVSAESAVCALVLDDYHLIESQAIHDAITFLIEHLPPPTDMTLVIASRTDPPLPLSRWRVRGELVELRATDLAFSVEETAVFLHNATGLTLSEQNIAALTARTEGWIAGLQMAALSIQGRAPDTGPDFIRSFTGSHHYILDYLTEEVLRQQPEQIQMFLLHTSILERLSGPLCDAVWNAGEHASWPSGQEILERLNAANLFIIPLDDERRWYRYHHLFADLLRNRLTSEQPEMVPILHQRASRWYEDAGFPEETIAHAFKAEDDGRLADLVEKYAWDMLHQSKYNLLFSWIEALSPAQVATRPWLCVYQSWTRHWAGQREGGEECLALAEQLLAHSPRSGDRIDDDRRLIAGYIATVRAHYALTNEDIPRVLKQAQKALHLLPEDDYFTRSTAGVALGGAYWGIGDSANAEQTYAECASDALLGGYPYRASSALCYKGMQQVKQARLQRAQETFQESLALATGPRGNYFPNAGYPLAKLGELACEWNDLEEADRLANEGATLCRQLGHVDLIAEALIALTRVQLAQMNFVGAKDVLQQLNRFLQETKVDSWIYCWRDNCRLRLWLAMERLDEVVNWIETCGLDVNDPLNYHYDLNHINLARALVAVGRQRPFQSHWEDVLDLLARLLTAAETAGWRHEAIKILILQALALQAVGDKEDALAALVRALLLAEPGGYIRSFFDEGEAMAELLQETNESNAASYASKLLLEWGVNNLALVEPLSQRELEVLKLLASGLSNKNIAQTLMIAVSTVKKHLKNIYQKLNAHSRTEAIASARELGILKDSD